MQEITQRIIKKVVPESYNVAAVVDKIKESEQIKPIQENDTDNINSSVSQLSKSRTDPMLFNVTLGKHQRKHHQSVQKMDAVSTTEVSEVQLNISTDDIVQDIITDGSQNKCEIGNEIKETVLDDIGSDHSLEKTEERSAFHTSKNVIDCKGDMSNQRNIPPASLCLSDESFDDDNGNSAEREDDFDESFLEFGSNFYNTPINNAPEMDAITDVLKENNSDGKKNYEKRKRQCKHNPWRFNQTVKRNPHFILLKNTALPCLKQDMVLDHNQVEKIEEHFSKTSRHISTPNKSPAQKVIRDYVNSPDEQDKENIPCLSLFDYDDFSPIKCKTPQKNWLPDNAKRIILESIQDDVADIMPFTSTPTKPNSVRRSFIREDEDDDTANSFGFDEIDNTIPNNKGKISEATPFCIKSYATRKQKEQVKEVEESLPQPERGESQIVSDSMEAHTFDYPEVVSPFIERSKIYVSRPRQKRLKSVELENEEDYPPKRNKKDVMTKAEEAALEDWAAKFNSMCREIEKYNLEIE